VGGFQGLVDNTGQIVADGIQIQVSFSRAAATD